MGNYSRSYASMSASSQYASFASPTFTLPPVYMRASMEYTPRKATSEKGDHAFISEQPRYVFAPDAFLTGVPTRLINAQEELMPIAEEAFLKTTGMAFPDDIAVRLCSETDLAKAWGPGYHDSIQGFCRRHGKLSEVFVKRGDLAHTLLTLGHEIGHAVSAPLPDIRNEEAKAFAFSLAWMDTIREHNIASLKTAIHPRPAENGVHNVAFNFVASLARAGNNMLQTFLSLARSELRIPITEDTYGKEN
jgi:hypothetical protein